MIDLNIKKFLENVTDNFGLNNITLTPNIDLLADAIALTYDQYGYPINTDKTCSCRSVKFIATHTSSVHISATDKRPIRESSYNNMYLEATSFIELGEYAPLADFARKCIETRNILKRDKMKSLSDRFYIIALKLAANMIYSRVSGSIRQQIIQKCNEIVLNDVAKMQENGAEVLYYNVDEIVYIGDVQKLALPQHDDVLISLGITADGGIIRHYMNGTYKTRGILRTNASTHLGKNRLKKLNEKMNKHVLNELARYNKPIDHKE